MWKFLKLILITLSTIICLACGSNTATSQGKININADNLSADSIGFIPVLSGNIQAGFYLHNNTQQVIDRININVLTGNTTKTIALLDSKCTKLSPNSKCFINLNQIAAMQPIITAQSLAIHITYKVGDSNQQFKFDKLVNLVHVSNKDDGIFFAPVSAIYPHQGKKGYALAYFYVGGKAGTTYKINSLKSAKNSLQVINGSFIGKNVASGEIVALELVTNSLSEGNYSDSLLLDYTNQSNGKTSQAQLKLNIKSPEANHVPEIVASVNPLTDLTQSTSGNIFFYNAGDALASSLALDMFGAISITNNTCKDTLAANSLCQISYTIDAKNRGEFLARLSYLNYTNGRSYTSRSMGEYYTSDNINGLFSITPLISNVDVTKNNPGFQNITVRNLGRSSLRINNIKLSDSLNSSQNTLYQDSCTGITLAPSQECAYSIQIINNDLAAQNFTGIVNSTVQTTYYDNNNKLQKLDKNAAVDYIVTPPYSGVIATISPALDVYLHQDNSESIIRTITYTNVSDTVLQIKGTSLINPPNFVHEIKDNSSSCLTMASFKPGESCTVAIKFGPSNTTPLESGTIYYGLNISPVDSSKYINSIESINYLILPQNFRLDVKVTPGITITGTGKETDPYILSGGSNVQKTIVVSLKNTGSEAIAFESAVNNNVDTDLWDTSLSGGCIQKNKGISINGNEECTITYTFKLGGILDSQQQSYLANLGMPTLTILDKVLGKEFQLTPQWQDSLQVYADAENAVIVNNIEVESANTRDEAIIVSNTLLNDNSLTYQYLSIISSMDKNLYGLPSSTNDAHYDEDCMDHDSESTILQHLCYFEPFALGAANGQPITKQVRYPLKRNLVGLNTWHLNVNYSLPNFESSQWLGMNAQVESIIVTPMGWINLYITHTHKNELDIIHLGGDGWTVESTYSLHLPTATDSQGYNGAISYRDSFGHDHIYLVDMIHSKSWDVNYYGASLYQADIDESGNVINNQFNLASDNLWGWYSAVCDGIGSAKLAIYESSLFLFAENGKICARNDLILTMQLAENGAVSPPKKVTLSFSIWDLIAVAGWRNDGAIGMQILDGYVYFFIGSSSTYFNMQLSNPFDPNNPVVGGSPNQHKDSIFYWTQVVIASNYKLNGSLTLGGSGTCVKGNVSPNEVYSCQSDSSSHTIRSGTYLGTIPGDGKTGTMVNSMDYSVYYLSNSSEIYEYKTNHGIVDFTTQQKIYQESSTNNVLWRQNNSNELITLSAPSLPKLNGIAVIEH